VNYTLGCNLTGSTASGPGTSQFLMAALFALIQVAPNGGFKMIQVENHRQQSEHYEHTHE